MDLDNIYESLCFSGRLLGISFLTAASIILVRDFSWYFLDWERRDQTKTTKNCYDWFVHYLPITDGEDIDYSEGIFDFNNKPSMTLQEATRNKYEYIFAKLELKAGMVILDAGCGNGVWMDFCRSKGVKTIGLTLSPEQAKLVRAKGLEVEVGDYRVEKPEFIGKFDGISVMGSTEHISSSRGLFANDAARNRSNETLTEAWRLLKRYLKPGGKLFVTTLTVNDQVQWSLMDYFQAYVLDQHYGGYYPRMSDIQYKVAPAAGLTVMNVRDHTKDYQWSSMVEPKHFGYFKINWSENTWDKVTYIFISLAKSPLQFPFHCLYQGLDTWMWQFGGPQHTPLTDQQVANARVQLKYFMMTPTPILNQKESLTIPVPQQHENKLSTMFKFFESVPKKLPSISQFHPTVMTSYYTQGRLKK